MHMKVFLEGFRVLLRGRWSDRFENPARGSLGNHLVERIDHAAQPRLIWLWSSIRQLIHHGVQVSAPYTSFQERVALCARGCRVRVENLRSFT